MAGSLATSFFSFDFSSIQFGFRDLFDILLIAILIYVVIRIFRETHSLPAVIGVMSIVLLYGVALIFDLPLTRLILRSFFGFFLVFIAVIFQRELRRFFSSFGFFNIATRLRPPTETILKEISHSVFMLVTRGEGGLIVFPGKENIENQLEGGFYLNGEISRPLLLSIFDEASPGHDGALIIRNNKVSRFGAHLPLAEDVQKVRHLGLRHRAALGLSERSDALILVISQESGKVSLAHDGALYTVPDEGELEKAIRKFYNEKYPHRNFAMLGGWFIKNAFTLSASLITAFLIWFAFNSQFTALQRNFTVVPEFKNIPQEYLVKDIIPQEIVLTVLGRSSELNSLQSEDLHVRLDGGELLQKEGWHTVSVGKENVKLPFNFSLVSIEPATLKVQVIKSDNGAKNF